MKQKGFIMKLKAIIISLLSITLWGCNSTPDQKALQDKNKNLQQQLTQANSQIAQLTGEGLVLKKEIKELNQIVAVLDTEKSSRVEESSELRSQVRKFVQNNIDALKQFLVKGNLLDYVGGELVSRPNLEDKALSIIDLSNTMPRSGVLSGVGAYVSKPTSLKVKLLRTIDTKLVTIWQSDLIELNKLGENTVQFNNTVGIEQGDIIAYEFPNKVGVGYTTGTANTRYIESSLNLGTTIERSELEGKREKRAYSLGVYGLLD